MESFSWCCPYCNQNATITKENYSDQIHIIERKNEKIILGINTIVITCPNIKCNEFQIIARLYKINRYYTAHQNTINNITGDPIISWNLKPSSTYKIFPDYIPKSIVDDYIEACEIKNLSPKASATLSRRCLQGIIRDFWGIRKERLKDEIDNLKCKIDKTTWDAIDAVRSIGNIGAHMEKDINIIIDVEENEAELLTELIETLFKDWYITRHDRENNLNKIIQIAENKKKGKK